MEKLEPCACCWECKMVQTLWKTTEGPQIKLENTTVWSSGLHMSRRTEQSLRHICTQEYSSIIYNSQATEVAQGFTDSWMENVVYTNKETLSARKSLTHPTMWVDSLRMWPWDCKWLNWNRSHWGNHTEWARVPAKWGTGRAHVLCLLSSPWTCPGVAPFKDPSSSSWEAGKDMFLTLTCLCYNVSSDKALLEILRPLTSVNWLESKSPGW